MPLYSIFIALIGYIHHTIVVNKAIQVLRVHAIGSYEYQLNGNHSCNGCITGKTIWLVTCNMHEYGKTIWLVTCNDSLLEKQENHISHIHWCHFPNKIGIIQVISH